MHMNGTVWRAEALLYCLIGILLCLPGLSLSEEIQTGSTALSTRIAPGETLPIQVNLLNFGRNERVDVTVAYEILNPGGKSITTYREVVALETTASFIHNINLPENIKPGTYLARTTVTYGGQESPAIASYQFAVERKIAGIFVTDLWVYALIAFLAILASGLLFVLAKRLSHASRHFTRSFDYSQVPHKMRIYFEIVSDMVEQMRLHEGERALAMARDVSGLSLDDEGRVLRISGDPASVVAVLVTEYEARFGRKMSFSLPHAAHAHALVKVH